MVSVFDALRALTFHCIVPLYILQILRLSANIYKSKYYGFCLATHSVHSPPFYCAII